MPTSPEAGSYPLHSVLPDSWQYKIEGISFQIDPTDQRNTRLELKLVNGTDVVRLLFVGAADLEIQPDFPWADDGIQILDISSRGMEDVRVEVKGIESSASTIRFTARTVERVDA